ncbi:excalibur calcium-binding domain-containing protein [Arthrobacter sp. H14]|uniref:excalibur calcium-binding domain-containing protein n=1 Tax=Arthrobacter sp. H14 TaxID=1312959 RepID=UPI0004ADB9DE|nr:excalibur calcium-binding domain-containing protein [Arthrobacter sp. H14]
MNKSTAGLALAAAVGFSALSATPAMAATALPFENCTAAANAGVFNIPAASPAYGTHLDRDRDGFGCDAAGTAPFDPSIVADIVAENTPPADDVDVAPEVPENDQMDEVPVGGVDTGVVQESGNNVGALALGGGFILAAAAGGTYMVRRRNDGQA